MKASLLAAALLLAVPMTVTSVAHAKPPHYDCSKKGNANKAACKTAASSSTSSSAAAGASSSTVATAQAPKTRNYDCTKAGNKNKAQCKATAVATTTPPAPTVTAKPPVSMPANTVTKPAATPVAAATAGAPAGAAAQCKDGTYSMSKHHSGSCSHHGGVAKWLS
jgi:hypothetical protein